ncbi:hypothetical protein ACRALDRAFT_1077443 [Sodiomyces alcalophilus JCM 7366]|uniref:uncharacterized protein n=1 Tax=Sodiomyces alcalophilus JCM 7366 TaxID=591952 RepID=UPI0039B45958
MRIHLPVQFLSADGSLLCPPPQAFHLLDGHSVEGKVRIGTRQPGHGHWTRIALLLELLIVQRTRNDYARPFEFSSSTALSQVREVKAKLGRYAMMETWRE